MNRLTQPTDTTPDEQRIARPAVDPADRAAVWSLTLDDLLRGDPETTATAKIRRASQDLADFLVTWDPVILEWLWRTSRVTLNLTRLRALARALFQWRELTAHVRVLEAIAQQTGRPGDRDLAQRRSRTLATLRGMHLSPAVPPVHTDSLPHSVPVITDSLVKAGLVGAATADDLPALVAEAQTKVGHLSAGTNVLGFRVEGGFYGLLAGLEASRRWGAPVVEWWPGSTLTTVVEDFAEALGMGEAPSRPTYRSHDSDLHRLCAAYRDAAWAGSGGESRVDGGTLAPSSALPSRRTVVVPAGLVHHRTATLEAAQRLTSLYPSLDLVVADDVSAAAARQPDRIVLVTANGTELTPDQEVARADGGPALTRLDLHESDHRGAVDVLERLREAVSLRDGAAPDRGWLLTPEAAEGLPEARRRAWTEVTAQAVAAARDFPMADLSGWFHTRDNAVEEILSTGWRFAEFPLVSLEEPIEWDRLCLGSRSWNFQFHSWRFMDSVMREYVRTGDVTYLQWCLDRAVSWAARFVGRPAGETLSWYDMALGLRSSRLAALIWAAVQAGARDDVIGDLVRCARAHVAAHAEPDSFNPRTNHGYYAALGQTLLGRVLAALPEMAAMAAEGEQRLELMVTQQFAADGGHTEHSPDYHRMVLGSFVTATEHGLIRDPEVARRIEIASHVLGWFILPNGEILQFGDSPARNMRSVHSVAFDPHTLFLATDGAKGEPIDEELLVLPETGYAVVRSPQPSASTPRIASSYLALQAGFHSRAHKHADDLTLVWFDRGREILVDGGRYGYGELLPKDSPLRLDGHYYADPARRYLESSVAHNTVTVGDVDHDRRRRPYGSALGDCVQRDGVFTLAGEVAHADWTHSRDVDLRPGLGLVVHDELTLTDRPERVVTLWFNLDGELDLEVDSEGLLRATHPQWDVPLWIRHSSGGELVAPVRGGEEPLRGWRSKVDRQLLPAWNLGWRIPGAAQVNATTIFQFSVDPPGAGTRAVHDKGGTS